MKVVDETIRRITISEIPCLDPIRVALEDMGPGQGRINIECYGTSWACYWGGMGDQTIAEFFSSCDQYYLANKLSSIDERIFDPDHLKESLKREVLSDRRKMNISGGFARERYNTINDLEIPESEEQLWSIAKQLEEIIGEEWWYSIPKKPNPDYEYLCRIIIAVTAALKSLAGG